MSVFNGQIANATTFNNAFLSRTVDSSTVGKITLANADPASGSSITNIQREFNAQRNFVGTAPNQPISYLPPWTSNDIGSSTDPLFNRTDLLTAAFNNILGHAHDGTQGSGAPISSLSLSDFNSFFAEWQTNTFTSAAGLNDDVTLVFTGRTAGGGPSTLGVPTTAPYNRVELRTHPNGDKIEEPGGKVVYGRITESAGTWTLTYYYEDSGGIETAYSLPSQDIRLYWREVFSSETRPTFGTETGFIGSFDATADIIDASITQSGKVNTTSQSFAGLKTFDDGAVFNKAISTEKIDVASSATINALSSANSFVKLTGATATELQGISAPSTAIRMIVYNASSADLTIKHENVGALSANRIITPDASDLLISSNSSCEFLYDLSDSRWRVVSTPGGGGGIAKQESLGSGDGIQTSFGPLSSVPSSEDSIAVFVNGVLMDESTWSFVGADVVFVTPPGSGSDVYVYYLTSGTPTILGPTGTQNVEYRTLTNVEATSESLTLSQTPASASLVMVDLIGGSSGHYGVDFTVSGASLSWAGLGYSGLLSSGDVLRINYLS